MFTVDGIRKFHDWTHASLTILLDHLTTLPAADYEKTVSGFGFPTLRDQVIHIFNCEGSWIHILQGHSYFDRTAAECPAVADAKLMQEEIRNQTRSYLSGLTNEQLNADTELHFSDGDVAVRTPSLVLHHLLTHAFHHKGQIVAMCRALGHPGPDTDMIRFE
jgi:uncharacterized damage-inducible protein DinB